MVSPEGHRFVVDFMLGGLTKRLRMLGFDVLYYRGSDPKELLQIARKESRTLLTRRQRGFPHSGAFPRLIVLSENLPENQIIETIARLNLKVDSKKLFSRCLKCNSPLEKACHAEVEGKIPEFVLSKVKEFSTCPVCGTIYWRGSHYENMKQRIDEWSNRSGKRRIKEAKRNPWNHP